MQALTKGSLGSLVLRCGFVGLEFACGISIAWVFGAPSYGAYAFSVSCTTLLAIPAVFGLDRLLVRQVASLSALGEWQLLKGALHRASQIALIGSVALAGSFAAVLITFDIISDTTVETALLLGIFTVPVIAYSRIRQAALQGLGKVATGQLPEMLIQPGLLLVLVFLWYRYAGPDTGPTYEPVVLYVLASVVACCIGAVMLRAATPLAILQVAPTYQTREWLRQAIPFAWLLSMNAVVTHLDTIVVGFMRGAVEAGIFRVASQMAMLVTFPVTAVNMAAAPVIAALYAKQDMTGIAVLARRSAQLALGFAVPIAFVLVVFGKHFLALFGPEFRAGYPSLVLLCFAYALNAAAATSGYLLIMTRHEKFAALGFTCAALVNVVALLVFVRFWHLFGAAMATSLSVVIVSAIFTFFAWRKVGIQPTALPLPSPAHESPTSP